MWTAEDRALVGDFGAGQALSDEQYRLLEPLIPPAKPGGRSRTTDMRRLLDGLSYLVRTGCQWRHLPPPPVFPSWPTVYGYLRAFMAAGVWESMRHHLVLMLREREGRAASPTAAIIDTQSVKTTEQGGPRGRDAFKKVSGRKRHILVDTLGLLLAVVVHSAGIQDRDGARSVLAKVKGCFPRLKTILADGIYNGGIAEWAQQFGGWVLRIAPKPEKKKGEPFKVVKWRWIVERTFAWLGRYRRLSKDYERQPESGEAMIYIAMTQLMLRRLETR